LKITEITDLLNPNIYADKDTVGFQMPTYFQNERDLSKDYKHRSQCCPSYLTDILAVDTQNVKKNPTGSHLEGEWQGN
jgi:hypothetical protein